MKLNILHLADLHVNKEDEVYLQSVASALCKDVATLPEGFRPDIVCVTGDLINKGENSAIEFPLAQQLFLQPLAKSLSLNSDDFYFVPGNHEIDRSKVSKAFELGFNLDIADEQSLRRFVMSATPQNNDFTPLAPKLGAYFDFLGKYPNQHLQSTSFFYTTYKRKINNFTVGIVALNSAWRCSQHGADNKRLLVSEHALIDAASKLADCDIRVCLCHHPFEMLADWDEKPVRQKVAKHFDILLNGHVHDSNAVAARQLFGSIFMSTAGCLRPNEVAPN